MHKLVPILILIVILSGIFYVVNGNSFAMDFSSSLAASPNSDGITSYFSAPRKGTSVDAGSSLNIIWVHKSGNKWFSKLALKKQSKPVQLDLYKNSINDGPIGCSIATDTGIQICGSYVMSLDANARGTGIGGSYKWKVPADVGSGSDYTVVGSYKLSNGKIYEFQSPAFKIVGKTTTAKKSPCAGMGDVNSDDFVTNDDADLITSYVVKNVEFSSNQWIRADVSADNKVSSYDASYVRRYVKGTISTFPACGQKTTEPIPLPR